MTDPYRHGRHRSAADPYEETPMSQPVVPGAKPVERKVSVATAASYVTGLVLATIVQSLQDGSLIAMLPPTVSALLAPLVPSLLVFLAGYMTTNKVAGDDVKRLAVAVQTELAAQIEARVENAIDRVLAGRGQ